MNHNYTRTMRSLKGILLLFILVLVTTSVQSQCMMRPLSLAERVGSSELIVEGKVLGQKSFWDHEQGKIFTVNKIEVYKVFKGTLNSNVINVLTQGGVVGMDMIKVEPSLGLIPGEVGILTLNMSGVTLRNYEPNFLNGLNNNSGTRAGANVSVNTSAEVFYQPYGSAQGYVHYDRGARKAIGVFDQYDEVENDLYLSIHNITSRGFAEIKPFDAREYINQTSAGARGAITITDIYNTADEADGAKRGIAPAGTFTEITIEGTGFGTAQGTILFPEADAGVPTAATITCPAVLINSWTDTEIKVMVPSGAGTGNVEVRHAVTGSGSAALTIPFNISSVSNEEHTPDMINLNGSGGYTWVFNNSFYTNKPAVARFGEALCAWTGASNVNWDTAATQSSISCENSGDGVSIVTFDNDCALPGGVLGTCYSSYSGCFSGGVLYWHVASLDIKFDAGTNWYYGAGTAPVGTGDGISTGILFAQYDFMSVALHEVGHGHQIGHFSLTTDIMYPSVSNGVYNRAVDVNATRAGQFVMDRWARQAASTAQTDVFEVAHTGQPSPMGSFVANPCGIGPMTQKTCNALPNCFDGIQNQTGPAETGVDCGGPCAAACPTCSDGIKNQDETSIDCGGVCGGQQTNDTICGAVALPGCGAPLTGEDNSCASDGLFIGCTGGKHQLWYTLDLTAGQDGIDVTISNSSSGGNFEIIIIGPNCNSLLSYGADCGVEGTFSFTSLPVDSTYFIGVSVPDGDEGTFDICGVGTSSPCVGGAPANDDICSATPLVMGVCTALQTDSCSTSDYNGGCVAAGNLSVWYEFTPVAPNNKVEVSFSSNTFLGGNVDLMLLGGEGICSDGIWVGSQCGSATNDTFTFTALNPDSTYWLMVSSPQGSQGDFQICINQFSDPCLIAPAANDSICSAEVMNFVAGTACVSGSNNCSFPDYNTGCMGANANTVWYEFDLTGINSDVNIQFSNVTTTGDTLRIGIIEGVNCDSSLAWVYSGCHHESDSIVLQGLDSTLKYYIGVSTYIGEEGDFDMCVTESVDPCVAAGSPANDTICGAVTVPLNGTCVTNQTTICSTPSIGGGGCLQAGSNVVWYKFMLTTGPNNKVDIAFSNDSFPGDINSMLLRGAKLPTADNCSEYGASLPALTIVGTVCQDPNPDSIHTYTELEDSVMYYLVVGTPPGEEGTFDICVQQGIVPPGSLTGPEQECNGAIAVCNTVYTTNDAYIGFGATQEVFTGCLGAQEKNSVWYVFTAQDTGALGFEITSDPDGNGVHVDYDFALYDISTAGCDSIPLLDPVRCNFCGDQEMTGIDVTNATPPNPQSAGTTEGGANPCDPFEEGIRVVTGETYALVIDNYTADNTGYTLEFFGASIFDSVPPNIWSVTPDCGNNAISISTDEPVLCASINLADFIITNLDDGFDYTSTLDTIYGVGCGGLLGQMTNEIIIEHDGSWPSGNYQISIDSGNFIPNLSDKCGNIIEPWGYLNFEYVVGNMSISSDKSFICNPGDPVTITVSGLPDGEAYILNPGGQANTSGVFNVNPLTTTTYIITTDYAGCSKNTSIGVQVVEDIVTTVTPNSVVICSGTTDLIASTLINGFPCQTCTHTWSPTPGSGGLGQYDTVNVGAGTHSVQAQVPEGCLGNVATGDVVVAGGGSTGICEVMYVSPTGLGSNHGLTKDMPTTLDSALARSLCTSTVIRCEVGDYIYGNYVWVNGFVTIEGGYLPGFNEKTSLNTTGNGTRFFRTSALADDGTAIGNEYSMFKVVSGATNFRFQDLKILMPGSTEGGATCGSHAVGSNKTNYGINIGNGCSGYSIVRCVIDAGDGSDL